MTTGTTPNLWPEWTEEDNAVSAQVQKRIAEVYPQMGGPTGRGYARPRRRH